MHDAAIIIISALRPTLERAVLSVYAQQFAGTIQVIVGVDADPDVDRSMLSRLAAACPAGRTLTIFDLGYPTAESKGGLYSYRNGGILGSIASFVADSVHIAYLDDDDWYAPEHVRTLREAVGTRPWGFALSWYVNPANNEPMCIDLLESAGPGRGGYKEPFGGFVRPSCLMLNKLICAPILHLWGTAAFPTGRGSDRHIFASLLRHFPQWGESGLASVFYTVQPGDINHEVRLRYAQAQGYNIRRVPGGELLA